MKTVFKGKRFLGAVALLVILVILNVANHFKKEEELHVLDQDSNVNSVYKNVLVTRVIDGDTIELETGQKVRYIGMNTPEIHHPTKPVECFGREAAKINSDLVLNKEVRLEKDVSETDKYHRLLRYVYLSDGTFVNLKLVQEGYAYVDTVPPDVKFSDKFRKAVQEAREGKKGLWDKCK